MCEFYFRIISFTPTRLTAASKQTFKCGAKNHKHVYFQRTVSSADFLQLKAKTRQHKENRVSRVVLKSVLEPAVIHNEVFGGRIIAISASLVSLIHS